MTESLWCCRIPFAYFSNRRKKQRLHCDLFSVNLCADDHCSLCSGQDSIIHTFAECPVTVSIHNCNLNWFNDISNLNVSPLIEQFLFHLMGPKSKLTVDQERRLDLLALCTKQYLYASKTLLKIPSRRRSKELQSKIEIQWKIEHCSLTSLD